MVNSVWGFPYVVPIALFRRAKCASTDNRSFVLVTQFLRVWRDDDLDRLLRRS